MDVPACSGSEMMQKVALGTTIIAVSYNGGVVVGADTRTSTGSYIANRVTDKLTPLADNIYMCRSGSAADTQAIASYVQFYIAQHQATIEQEVEVKTAANLVAQMAYSNKNMLEAGMIIGGYDARAGASVYSVPLGGTLMKVPYAIGGSGSAYIQGWVDKNFRAGMSEEECRAFVVKAASLAVTRDASSGGCVRTVTINAQGTKRDFITNPNIPLYYGDAAPLRVAA